MLGPLKWIFLILMMKILRLVFVVEQILSWAAATQVRSQTLLRSGHFRSIGQLKNASLHHQYAIADEQERSHFLGLQIFRGAEHITPHQE